MDKTAQRMAPVPTEDGVRPGEQRDVNANFAPHFSGIDLQKRSGRRARNQVLPAPRESLLVKAMVLEDRWGRQIRYLRLSVTSRCGMRCLYCRPPGVVLP